MVMGANFCSLFIDIKNQICMIVWKKKTISILPWIASTRSFKLGVGQDKGLKQTPKKVNARMSSKAIHSTGKTRVRVHRNDVYKIIWKNNDLDNNLKRNEIITW